MTTIKGYVPAIGETDTNKIIRSIRNLYENGTTNNVFPNGIEVTGALASGSLIDTNAVAVSCTNGIDLSACTFSGKSLILPFVNFYGNGEVDIGLNNLPLLSADTGRVATFVVKRNIAGTFPVQPAGTVRSAIRAVTNLANGSAETEWTILGICNDDGNVSAGSVAVYGQCNKTRDNSSMSDWGGVFEMHNHGLANPLGSEIGVEISMSGTGADGHGNRYGMLFSVFTDSGATYDLGTGIFFQAASAGGATMQYGIRFSSTFAHVLTCIDTASCTVSNFVLNMAQNQKISFGNGDKNLYYNSSVSSLEYQTVGGSILIGDGGKITCDSLVTAVIGVASLPAAAGNTGRRWMVNDAAVATFGAAVAGGGTKTVPVYSDGVSWIMG